MYRIPYYAREWEKPEAPRKWRPETTITPDILAVEPDLVKDIELQSIVSDYLRKKPVDEIPEDPIVRAAEQTKSIPNNEDIKIKGTKTKPSPAWGEDAKKPKTPPK